MPDFQNSMFPDVPFPIPYIDNSTIPTIPYLQPLTKQMSRSPKVQPLTSPYVQKLRGCNSGLLVFWKVGGCNSGLWDFGWTFGFLDLRTSGLFDFCTSGKVGAANVVELWTFGKLEAANMELWNGETTKIESHHMPRGKITRSVGLGGYHIYIYVRGTFMYYLTRAFLVLS